MIFDSRDWLTEAATHPAPGPTTSFSDVVGASWDEAVLNEMTISDDMYLYESYEQYIERLEGQTGKRLINPIHPAYSGQGITQKQTRHEFDERVSELAKSFPDMEIRYSEDFDSLFKEERMLSRRIAESVGGRASPFSRVTGTLVGTAGAVMLDPPILATMLIGAPIEAGIVRTALIEAAIAGAVEVPIQAALAQKAKELGEDRPFSQSLYNVSAAMLGAGVMAGTFKGIGRGTKALVKEARNRGALKTKEQNRAADALERLDSMIDESPYPPTRRGKALHVKTYDEALEAVKNDIMPSAVPDAPVRGSLLATTNLTQVEELAAGIRDDLQGIIDSAIQLRRQALETVPAPSTIVPMVTTAGNLRVFKTGREASKAAAKLKGDIEIKETADGFVLLRKSESELVAGPFGSNRAAERFIQSRDEPNLHAVPHGAPPNRKFNVVRGGRPADIAGMKSRPDLVEYPDVDRYTPSTPPQQPAIQRRTIARPTPRLGREEPSRDRSVEAAKAMFERLRKDPDPEPVLMAREARVRESITDDMEFMIQGPDGNIRRATAKEILDDIESDERAINEFVDCLKR